MTIIDIVSEIANLLESRGVSVYPHLKPGLLQREIDSSIVLFGVQPPVEYYELYKWHNGVDEGRPEIEFFAEHRFISIQEALIYFQAAVNAYQISSFDMQKCVPIGFSNGSIVAIYCERDVLNGLDFPIIGIFQDVNILFENLENMLKTTLAWYKAGIYDKAPVDDALRVQIWAQLNPNVP